MARKLMTVRVWIVLITIMLSIVAINPNPWAHGLVIKSVGSGSIESEEGINTGEKLLAINGQKVETLNDFASITKSLKKDSVNIKIETEKGVNQYEAERSIGFRYTNLTVTEAEDFTNLEKDDVIKSINDIKVEDDTGLKKEIEKLLPLEKITITTDKGDHIYLSRSSPSITVTPKQTTNIQKGLDLQGGTRVLLKPISDTGVTDKDVDDLIKVMTNRLNVYGLADMQIRPAKDFSGDRFVLIEIAGVTMDEIKELLAKQGKFEAKIANETVFIGGRDDIPFVCRNDGSCSGIRQCNPTSENQWYCQFEFVVHLSPSAAKRHAEVIKDLDTTTSTDGREILNETIEFYLDGKKVDSLQIGADLKGKEATAIAISGPGMGPSKMVAMEAAVANMDKLQTILITGSLPVSIEIAKMDTISPVAGKSFLRGAIVSALSGMFAVGLIIFIRYRRWKLTVPIMFVSITEIIMTVGVAAAIGWNMDLASIAGIIAAVGTGVNDQVIITDEIMRKDASGYVNWKLKIKNAFFIVFAAYATVAASLIPLWGAGAGLLRGFAVTTLIGISIGVFITRPAFASFMEQLMKDEQ